jgi:hypothetical protein
MSVAVGTENPTGENWPIKAPFPYSVAPTEYAPGASGATTTVLLKGTAIGTQNPVKNVLLSEIAMKFPDITVWTVGSEKHGVGKLPSSRIET